MKCPFCFHQMKMHHANYYVTICSLHPYEVRSDFSWTYFYFIYKNLDACAGWHHKKSEKYFKLWLNHECILEISGNDYSIITPQNCLTKIKTLLLFS